jgi:hypothetical protein
VKLTEIITIADLEATARLDPNTDPLARAVAEESLERALKFGPTFLKFAQELAIVGAKKGLTLDQRAIASAMLSAFVAIDVTIQRKTGDSAHAN